MITRIKRFSILKAGLMLGVLYGFIALIMLPIALLVLVFGGKEGLPILFLAIAYPIAAFVGGVIGAALYNLAAMLVGGLEVTLEATQEPPIG